MAENSAPDFGIMATKEISSDALFGSMESVTTNPDDVKNIKKEAEKKKKEVSKEQSPIEEEEFVVKNGENDDILNMLDDNVQDTDDDDDEEELEQGKKKEEKIVDKKETTKSSEEESLEDEDDNYINSISSELYKQGVFTVDGDEEIPEISTPEDLLNLFTEQKQKGALEILENILSRHGQDKRDLFDAVILKGVDPKTYLENFNLVEDLSSLDMAKESSQERVMREELKALGWETDDIEEEITKVKEYGDLESASKRYQKSLIKRTENKIIQEKEKRERQFEEDDQRDKQYKANISTILNAKIKEKEFDGIPVTTDLANKTFDSLYTKKWKLPSGETITDFDNEILNLKRPENHALKVKVGLILQILKTDPSLSSIKKKAITKESQSIFSELERKRIKSKSAAATSKPETKITSWF